MDKLRAIFTLILDFFHNGFLDLIAALTILAKSLEANLGEVGFAIVTSAVIAAETTPGTGEDRRKAAQAAAVAALTAKGLPVVMTAINQAIEAAYALHKANVAAADAPAPTAAPVLATAESAT